MAEGWEPAPVLSIPVTGSEEYTDASMTLSALQNIIDNITGNKPGLYFIGYMNAAVAINFGMNATYIIAMNVNSQYGARKKVIFYEIQTNSYHSMNKLGDTWSNIIN